MGGAFAATIGVLFGCVAFFAILLVSVNVVLLIGEVSKDVWAALRRKLGGW